MQPLRDDLPGTDPRTRHDRHVCEAAVGARLSVGAGRRRRAERFSTRSPPTGVGRWESRRARRAAPPIRRSVTGGATTCGRAPVPARRSPLTQMNAEIDVRDVLPLVRVPTLVLHRTGDRCLRVDEGRYVASLIPGAQFVELPGDDHLPFVGDQDAMLDEIAAFVTSADQVDTPGSRACHGTVRPRRQRRSRSRAIGATSSRTCSTKSPGSGAAAYVYAGRFLRRLRRSGTRDRLRTRLAGACPRFGRDRFVRPSHRRVRSRRRRVASPAWHSSAHAPYQRSPPSAKCWSRAR